MRKLALVLLAGLALLPAVGGAQPEVVRFTGATVSDEDLGIAVSGDREYGLVGVVSPRYRYALVLPWATDWKFYREGRALLRGNSGPWNLTVTAWETDEKPADHLVEKREFLEKNPAGRGIKKMEILSWKNERVLRNEVDASELDSTFKGVVVVHYFAAKSAKGVLYELHLSVVVSPQERGAFVDEDWMNYAAVGFRVGDRAVPK